MGITEILRRILLFSANKIKSSESVSNQPTQLNSTHHYGRNYAHLIHTFSGVGGVFIFKTKSVGGFSGNLLQVMFISEINIATVCVWHNLLHFVNDQWNVRYRWNKDSTYYCINVVLMLKIRVLPSSLKKLKG